MRKFCIYYGLNGEIPGIRSSIDHGRSNNRALPLRPPGEYEPWQAAAPHLLRIRDLLDLESARSGLGCAAAFRAYVLQNVTAPFVGALSSDAVLGLQCALPFAHLLVCV